MSEISHQIDDDDIEWLYDGKNGPENVFEPCMALALLLRNEVVFLNDHWWREDLPEPDRKQISVSVNCNDVFAWACADAEALPYAEIENVYRMWRKDPDWGPAIWCCLRRKQMLQPPVEKAIRKHGIWDLNDLPLGPNTQDAEVQAFFSAFRSHPSSTASTADPDREGRERP